MRKELLTLAVACLLCVPAFAADDEEPKGVSDIKEVGKVIRNPITIEATGGNQKMDVVFNHSSHRRVRCQTCHHALPSDIDAKYVSCGASEGMPLRAPWRRRRCPEPFQGVPRQGQRSFLLRLPYQKA